MEERIVILGAGESGTGAAILAAVKGYDVLFQIKEVLMKNIKLY